MTNPQPNDSSYQPQLDDLISLQDASLICRLTQPHLALLVRRGELWGKKIGRNWVTTHQEIERYLSIEHKPGPKRK